MTDSWIFFKEINFSDKSLNQFHIDTRDFHVSCNKEKSKKDFNLKTLEKYGNRFFFTAEDLKEILERLYYESGGKKEWRFLSLIEHKEWLKYIRVYKTEKGLLICNSDSIALNRDILNSKVNKKYLN